MLKKPILSHQLFPSPISVVTLASPSSAACCCDLLIASSNLLPRLLSPVRAAGEEHDDYPEKKDDHCGESSPHADAVFGGRTRSIFVDVVFDTL